jgi:hypothetical protein
MKMSKECPKPLELKIGTDVIYAYHTKFCGKMNDQSCNE